LGVHYIKVSVFFYGKNIVGRDKIEQKGVCDHIKTYKVTITEVLQMSVEVEAPSRREAERHVEKQWIDGDYILDADHFKGVTFAVPQKNKINER
jgi:hypothetical protein